MIRMRLLFTVLLGCAGLSACSCSDDAADLKKAPLAEGCLINTDCKSPLVCAFRRCHSQCTDDRDCTGVELCIPSDRPYNVCLLEDERECKYNTECPPGLVCAPDYTCRPECKSAKDCVAGQVCTEGTCAKPAELVDGSLPKPADAGTDVSVGQSCIYTSNCP